MNTQLIDDAAPPVLECLPGETLASEADALDLVAACGESGASRLLIPAECLSPAFFDLHSGLLGAALLKFSNYRVTVALVLRPEQVGRGKFYEWTLETNRGRDVRVFFERAAALEWLRRAGR